MTGVQTCALPIYDFGDMVGAYREPITRTLRGFAIIDGLYIPIDYPETDYFTEARGINNAGQIVGWWQTRRSYSGFGFIATPIPEPSTLTLLASGILSLALWRRKTN